MTPRRRAHFASALATTAATAVTITAVVAGHQMAAGSPSGAPPPAWTTVVEESFASTGSAESFATRGPGRWTVSRGAYRLIPPTHRKSLSRQALTVLRGPGPSGTWRLRATIRPTGERPDVSVVVAYRNRGSFAFVHFGRSRATSGIFHVIDGRATRAAPLTVAIRSGRTYVVDLVGGDSGLEVTLARRGLAPKRVGGTSDPVALPVRLGFGSRGSTLAISRMRVQTAIASPTDQPTGQSSTATPSPSPSPSPSPTVSLTPVAGTRNITVSTSAQLTAALADAQPGDAITMLDGVYTTKGTKAPLVIGGKQYVGTFTASTSGTDQAPIVLQGSPNAVIDGKPGEDGTGTQYGLYLAAADHWWVRGITIRNVSKGLVLDESDYVTLEGLTVQDTGQEAIHLRTFSSDNLVTGNTVRRTGLSTATYGEGIYVGSANSNWGTYTDGQPDASDRNRIIGNSISQTGAESMDIKEGTTGGSIQDNTFDGAGMSGSWADSWIDMKGNAWTITGNHGTTALEDGFQVHGALAGWGLNNVFQGNTADVQGPGYGFWLQNNVTGNVIACTNTVLNASSGFATIPCSP